MSLIKRLTLAACLLASSASFATATAPTKDMPPPLTTSDDWQFHVAPYLWAINMNGTLGIGRTVAHVDANFSQIWDHMSIGGMVWVDARKDKFDFFINAIYAKLTDNRDIHPVNLDATNYFGIYGAGLSYRVYESCFGYTGQSRFSLEPYIGARYTVSNTTININAGPFSVRLADDKNWTDPFIGARLNFLYTPAWSLILAADIGGTNGSSDYSYNATGLIGYHPQTVLTSTTFYLGYRLLDQMYKTGSGRNYFKWDMKLFGPILGVDIAF